MTVGPSRQEADDGLDGGLPAIKPPPSMAEYVRDVIRDDILSGRLAPGERLREPLMCTRTGVSRTPVREAMRLLQAEGLVSTERGRGTFVTERLSSREALMIYRCRLVIEPYMASAAAKRATPAEIFRCERILERFRQALEGESDSRAISSIDAEFHNAIYDASHSELVAIFRSYWAKLQLQLSARVYDRETPSRFFEEHVAILGAIRTGDGDAARKLMTAHIRQGELRIKESFAEESVR